MIRLRVSSADKGRGHGPRYHRERADAAHRHAGDASSAIAASQTLQRKLLEQNSQQACRTRLSTCHNNRLCTASRSRSTRPACTDKRLQSNRCHVTREGHSASFALSLKARDGLLLTRSLCSAELIQAAFTVALTAERARCRHSMHDQLGVHLLALVSQNRDSAQCSHNDPQSSHSARHFQQILLTRNI
jgi:hypothetical protein